MKIVRIKYGFGNNLSFQYSICDALRDLVPFVQFEKREKYPSKSVTFSCKLYRAILLKVTPPLNSKNNKSRNASRI